MTRLDIDARDVEAIVCSHGHFDHTAGLDGLIRRMGKSNLPVLIHPDFWTRRRVPIPARVPLSIPPPTRSPLQAPHLTALHKPHPHLLLQNSVPLPAHRP